jgi:hypothetical protein
MIIRNAFVQEQDQKGVVHTGINTGILCIFLIINKRLHLLSYSDNFTFQLYNSYGRNGFFK